MKLVNVIMIVCTVIVLLLVVCYVPPKIVIEGLLVATLVVAVYLLFDIMYLIIKGEKNDSF
jgi:hypothetical protein